MCRRKRARQKTLPFQHDFQEINMKWQQVQQKTLPCQHEFDEINIKWH